MGRKRYETILELSSDRIKVGKQIKSAREKVNMTRKELADIVGCSSHYIGYIERGDKSPNLDVFIKIVKALNVSSDILLQDVIPLKSSVYDSEFSLLVGWLPDNDKKMILKMIKMLSENLYEKHLKGILSNDSSI